MRFLTRKEMFDAIIPMWLCSVSVMRISSDAKVVYGVARWTYGVETGEIEFNDDQMASDCGLSLHLFTSALQELELNGLIERTANGLRFKGRAV